MSASRVMKKNRQIIQFIGGPLDGEMQIFESEGEFKIKKIHTPVGNGPDTITYQQSKADPELFYAILHEIQLIYP